MTAFTIEIRDYHGNILESLDEGDWPYKLPIPALGEPDFPLLSTIDTVGYTYLSSLQIGRLLKEIERLMTWRLAPHQINFMAQVAAMAQRARSRPHHQLVFVGD